MEAMALFRADRKVVDAVREAGTACPRSLLVEKLLEWLTTHASIESAVSHRAVRATVGATLSAAEDHGSSGPLRWRAAVS